MPLFNISSPWLLGNGEGRRKSFIPTTKEEGTKMTAGMMIPAVLSVIM